MNTPNMGRSVEVDGVEQSISRPASSFAALLQYFQ